MKQILWNTQVWTAKDTSTENIWCMTYSSAKVVLCTFVKRAKKSPSDINLISSCLDQECSSTLDFYGFYTVNPLNSNEGTCAKTFKKESEYIHLVSTDSTQARPGRSQTPNRSDSQQEQDRVSYLGFPRRAAWCKALNPLLLVMVTSAPASNRTDSISSLFLLMASCRGVSPSESWKENLVLLITVWLFVSVLL